jgi:hypothetical protein
LADATKRGFVADDVFVIVALCQTGVPGVPRSSLIRRAEKVLNWRTISGRPCANRVGAVGTGSEPAPTGPEPAAEPGAVVVVACAPYRPGKTALNLYGKSLPCRPRLVAF